ncbi:hypothetical protein [Enterovirga sp.]|jgi:hypothetical protein|uniref:hypothetical protein n=1 Tax=Enterovirga sp. TaxID=2026350 RepID=UPI0026247B3E|nr:hypothetical protein [Enterovirga sp.]MDB5592375.1 hypothetical protein [Enterovirga sp.]
MKLPIGLVLATLAASVPALADAPPVDAKRVRLGPPSAAVPMRAALPAYRPLPTARRAARVHRFDRFAVAGGPVYGAEPRYYPGAGGASPNAGFAPPVPVAVVGYREAYIGRGLLYNTPPEPTWASWSHRSDVISVKY